MNMAGRVACKACGTKGGLICHYLGGNKYQVRCDDCEDGDGEEIVGETRAWMEYLRQKGSGD